MKVKYPRTYHIWFSEGVQSDDKVQHDVRDLTGQEIVITEKLDGENTTLYRDHFHARSLDTRDHPSRHWVKGLWGQIRHEIPEGWRICGENVYAHHSILYDNLDSYFYVICIWNEKNECLSWDDTLQYCDLLGLKAMPELYRGVYDEKKVREVVKILDLDNQEGIVLRRSDAFDYTQYATHVLKWVRKNHVQTDEHWMFQPVKPNKLKGL
ncbi:MAG: RNA ligase family protein [Bacteroidia bacterium]